MINHGGYAEVYLNYLAFSLFESPITSPPVAPAETAARLCRVCSSPHTPPSAHEPGFYTVSAQRSKHECRMPRKIDFLLTFLLPSNSTMSSMDLKFQLLLKHLYNSQPNKFPLSKYFGYQNEGMVVLAKCYNPHIKQAGCSCLDILHPLSRKKNKLTEKYCSASNWSCNSFICPSASCLSLWTNKHKIVCF